MGPGLGPADGSLPEDVADDLRRLARPGVTLSYGFAGGGPSAVRTSADVRAAAPYVARAVVAAAAAGADAVVIDCTDQPGADEARAATSVPVVGAGEALASAVALERVPPVVWTGDALRACDPVAMVAALPPASLVALGGTGWSHVAQLLTAAGHTVLDPLSLAVAACLDQLDWSVS